MGRQWSFMIIKRKSDGKLLNVSDKKVRLYESMYTVPMNDEYDPTVFQNDADESEDVIEVVSQDLAHRPEVDNNMVKSIKSLREHKLQLPGRHARDSTKLEESAMYGNGHPQIEGLHLDQVVTSNVDQLAQMIAEQSKKGTSLKESILKAIRNLKPDITKGGLRQGKKGTNHGNVSTSNIVNDKRTGKKRRLISQSETSISGEPDDSDDHAKPFFELPIILRNAKGKARK